MRPGGTERSEPHPDERNKQQEGSLDWREILCPDFRGSKRDAARKPWCGGAAVFCAWAYGVRFTTAGIARLREAIMVRAHGTPRRFTVVRPWGFVPTAFAVVGVALGSTLVACGDEPAALSVGPVSFTHTQLATVPPSAIETLVGITSIALATADDAVVDRAGALGDRARVEGLAAAALREVTLAASEVGDAQLEARYETAPAYELEVRHLIRLADRSLPDAERASARAEAEAALQRARAGEDFPTLAGEVSEEPGALERGGLLQPGREGTWVDEFWTAASALAPGQISGVVESVFGFHVLRLEDRRPIPFAELRDRVAADVAELLPPEAAQAFVDSIASGIDVDAAAVLAWDIGERTQDAGAGTSSAATALARWPGGSLSAEDMRLFVVTGSPQDVRDAAGPEDARVALARSVATTVALADVARARGLVADEGAIAEALDDFRVRAGGWAAILGLAGPSDPESVAARALAGLMVTGQNATVARGEMDQRAPLLRTFYPVVRATP